jgi:hypothetical protein
MEDDDQRLWHLINELDATSNYGSVIVHNSMQEEELVTPVRLSPLPSQHDEKPSSVPAAEAQRRPRLGARLRQQTAALWQVLPKIRRPVTAAVMDVPANLTGDTYRSQLKQLEYQHQSTELHQWVRMMHERSLRQEEWTEVDLE